ncbi:MAG: hypothetical protein U0744_08535 [Gemmataceae bacterium]
MILLIGQKSQRGDMGQYIRVQSSKFAVLPGEAEELVNDGLYGKALAEYLVEKLRLRGYDVPFLCCEDWGWWVELHGFPFAFGVCIYGTQLEDGQIDLYVTDGAAAARQWSWRRFRFVSTGQAAEQLHRDLLAIFTADPDVQLLGDNLDSPFADDHPAA